MHYLIVYSLYHKKEKLGVVWSIKIWSFDQLKIWSFWRAVLTAIKMIEKTYNSKFVDILLVPIEHIYIIWHYICVCVCVRFIECPLIEKLFVNEMIKNLFNVRHATVIWPYLNIDWRFRLDLIGISIIVQYTWNTWNVKYW